MTRRQRQTYAQAVAARQTEADREIGRQMIGWACGTLRKLGFHFEFERACLGHVSTSGPIGSTTFCDGRCQRGHWLVITPSGWETAGSPTELARIAQACLEEVREMNAAEGPLPEDGCTMACVNRAANQPCATQHGSEVR